MTLTIVDAWMGWWPHFHRKSSFAMEMTLLPLAVPQQAVLRMVSMLLHDHLIQNETIFKETQFWRCRSILFQLAYAYVGFYVSGDCQRGWHSLC